MFKSSSKFTIQIVSFLVLHHMHRTSLLYYSPQFVEVKQYLTKKQWRRIIEKTMDKRHKVKTKS